MMKIYGLVLLLVFLPTLSAAEGVDLLSEDVLLGTSAAELDEKVADNTTAEQLDEEVEEKEEGSSSMFGFIVNPLMNLFSSDDEISDQSSDAAESYLEKNIRLADEGNVDSQMNLGYMYLYGVNGIEQNFDNALKYYAMAAEQKDPIALNNLGSLYFNGIGTKRDVKKALSLFEQASELGNDNASVNLAFIYLTGGKKDAVRNKKALDLFQKASDEGNKIARFMLGYAYYKGFVVPQDFKKAFQLIRTAAYDEEKIDEAQIILAQMYVNGDGTVQNYQNAIAAYRSAFQQGNIEACMALADIYKNGKMTERNLVLAHTIYNVAASQGNKKAAKKRDELGEVMVLDDLKKAQVDANAFQAEPSELTSFIRQTYGDNIRHYIDINL